MLEQIRKTFEDDLDRVIGDAMVTDLDGLTEFLLTMVAVDEQAARAALEIAYEVPSDAPWEATRIALESGRPVPAATILAFRYNPERVLREVQAKRTRIVAAVEVMAGRIPSTGDPRIDRAMLAGAQPFAEAALCSEAEAYADHPECQPGWRI